MIRYADSPATQITPRYIERCHQNQSPQLLQCWSNAHSTAAITTLADLQTLITFVKPGNNDVPNYAGALPKGGTGQNVDLDPMYSAGLGDNMWNVHVMPHIDNAAGFQGTNSVGW